MRIAMIGHKRIAYNEGGIEKTVRELSVRMADAGHDITVYDRSGKSPEKRACDDPYLSKVRVKKAFTPKGAAGVPVYSFIASLKAAFGRYDVVMYHASGPCRMLSIPKLFRKKTAAFIHGIDSERGKWGGFASSYLRKGEKKAARSADALMVLSENMKNYFLEKYGREAIVVKNGTEPPVIPGNEGEILEGLGLKEDGYYFWSGRITEEKGLDSLIKAFKKLETGRKLVLAGARGSSIEYYDSIKELAAEDDRIILAGFRDRDELSCLYKNARAFLFPSFLEGMAHSLLEALSCGALCIISDIPENRETAGEYGLYFKPGDPDDILEKLLKAENDAGLKERLTAGQAEHILKKYDWDSCCEEIISVLEDLLK